MSAPRWMMERAARERKAMFVAEVLMNCGQSDPSVDAPHMYMQLAGYVMALACGNDGAYRVSELVELVENYRARLDERALEHLTAHIERVRAL